jgi:hypothetical protein
MTVTAPRRVLTNSRSAAADSAQGGGLSPSAHSRCRRCPTPGADQSAAYRGRFGARWRAPTLGTFKMPATAPRRALTRAQSAAVDSVQGGRAPALGAFKMTATAPRRGLTRSRSAAVDSVQGGWAPALGAFKMTTTAPRRALTRARSAAADSVQDGRASALGAFKMTATVHLGGPVRRGSTFCCLGERAGAGVGRSGPLGRSSRVGHHPPIPPIRWRSSSDEWSSAPCSTGQRLGQQPTRHNLHAKRLAPGACRSPVRSL